MDNKFAVYAETRGKEVLKSFHAHQIVSVLAADKCLDVIYIDERSNQPREAMLSGTSCKKLLARHGTGFYEVVRGHLINRQHMVSLVPTHADTSGLLIVQHMPRPVTVARRQEKKIAEIIKEKNRALARTS